MLKALLTLWIIFGLLVPAGAQQVPASGAEAPASGISLPPTIGGLKRYAMKKYDQPELGVVYRYRGGQLIKGDVFIYDMGRKNLGTGLKSPQMRPHFEQVKNDINRMGQMGHYQAIVKVYEEVTDLTTPAGKVPALSATFTYSQVGKDSSYAGTRISHLLLTAYKDFFIKIRFTYPETEKGLGDNLWGLFLADLGRKMK